MKKLTLSLGLALLALFAFARPAPAQDAVDPTSHELTMLRMFDGSILWGSIEDHDAQTLHFVRLDNGGHVRVPWSRLDPSLSEELLEKFGYVDHSGDELMIEAERLVLDDNSEVVGIIVNRTDTDIWVKTAEAVRPVPKLKLRGAATTVQVPALEVYTRDELYQLEVAKADPRSAQSQWDMSIYCERIFDFQHAVDHLHNAAQLDPSFKTEEIKTALARNQTKLENQVQIDALRDIDHLRSRGKFDEAEKACDQFLEKNATSSLRADATKKKLQIQKAREKFLAERAVEQHHTWLGRLTQAAGRDSKMTLEAALAYLDEKLGQDVLQHVQADLARFSPSVTPDQVVKYWKERKVIRWRRASYGSGSFLLGRNEARKGLDEGADKAKDAPKTETDAARAKLEERIKRYVDNQEIVRKAKNSNPDDENENEKFWLEFSASSKASWLLAYYVEHSGDMRVRGASFTNCPDCGGTSVREVINTAQVAREDQAVKSNTQLVTCPTCHGVGVFRVISYQ